MNAAATTTGTRSVVIEREFPYPPEKLWRALSQPHLLQEWLMKSDFLPAVGHRFKFTADWGVVDCEVLKVEPPNVLSYTWCAHGLESVVTFTLSPRATGTLLRMEQAGFRADQEHFHQGALGGWPRFLTSLEQVLASVQ